MPTDSPRRQKKNSSKSDLTYKPKSRSSAIVTSLSRVVQKFPPSQSTLVIPNGVALQPSPRRNRPSRVLNCLPVCILYPTTCDKNVQSRRKAIDMTLMDIDLGR
jgi:hypothetical protein